jgi:hypothetical protein
MKRMMPGALFLLLSLACEREQPANRPLPDTFPAQRSAILDSALAVSGLTVEYHWEAPDTAVAGAAASPYVHPHSREPLNLFDTVSFDLDGVAAARVAPAGAGATVTLEITLAAGERLLHTTTWHEGERIGVLVNGRLVTVATVRSPLTNMLPVVDLVPRDQAEALAERINARIREAGGAAPRR